MLKFEKKMFQSFNGSMLKLAVPLFAMEMLACAQFSSGRFQLILPVHSHNITKNLTGHRMHVEGHQIYQINKEGTLGCFVIKRVFGDGFVNHQIW